VDCCGGIFFTVKHPIDQPTACTAQHLYSNAQVSEYLLLIISISSLLQVLTSFIYFQKVMWHGLSSSKFQS